MCLCVMEMHDFNHHTLAQYINISSWPELFAEPLGDRIGTRELRFLLHGHE